MQPRMMYAQRCCSHCRYIRKLRQDHSARLCSCSQIRLHGTYVPGLSPLRRHKKAVLPILTRCLSSALRLEQPIKNRVRLTNIALRFVYDLSTSNSYGFVDIPLDCYQMLSVYLWICQPLRYCPHRLRTSNLECHHYLP